MVIHFPDYKGLGQFVVPFTCIAATAIILSMDSKQHVFDFLAKPVGQTPVGVCVLHGSERFLKTLAMKHLTGADAEDSAELSVTKFDATNSKWADIYDELSTRSLFGGDGIRIVIVDDADKFVSENRDRLEKFAEGQGAVSYTHLTLPTNREV